MAAVLAAGIALTAVGTLLATSTGRDPVDVDPVAFAQRMNAEAAADLVEGRLPDAVADLSAREAAAEVAQDPQLAVQRSDAVPNPDADDPAEAGLAELLSLAANSPAVVSDVYERLSGDVGQWLTAVFPGAVGNLSGAPYAERIEANRIRLAAATADSAAWPSPPRPWSQDLEREPRADLQRALDLDMQLVYFDPTANSGHGSWVELIGDVESAVHVGVLAPGGSAFISSDNFTRYSNRAQSFVDASDGELAMLVWAAGPSPTGWIQQSFASWARDSAPLLADFVDDVRRQTDIPGLLTLAGHSYGGAVVGLAETYPLAVDRVMHVASAGAGYAVSSTADYSWPCRPRYAMMAPGDPISRVQNVPHGLRLGHGVAAAELPGVTRLETGSHPDDPDAVDDVGRKLGDLGIAGAEISGVHAHSEVFVPDSEAWQNMFAVLVGGDVTLAEDQPDPDPSCD